MQATGRCLAAAPELAPRPGREHRGLISNHTSIFSTKCMCPNDLSGPFQSVAAEPAPGARQLPTESPPAQDFLCFSQMSTYQTCHDLVRSALVSSWPGWSLQEKQGKMSRGSKDKDRPVVATRWRGRRRVWRCNLQRGGKQQLAGKPRSHHCHDLGKDRGVGS